MKISLASLFLILVTTAFPVQGAVNLIVTGVQTQIAGTSTDVPGGGAAANFGSSVVGDFAVFDIGEYDPVTMLTTPFGHLRVTYAADNGGVGSNIMIARTTNSQGLLDAGTVSVLISTQTSPFTVDLDFDWFTLGSFAGGVEQGGAALITTQISYTGYDIDFRQLNRFRKDDVLSYLLNSPTLLTATDDGVLISFEDNNASSAFDDPKTAFQVITQLIPASHTVTMGNQIDAGFALFMFEFRDPSNITFVVPEPSASMLILGSLVGLLLRRRRSR